MSDQPDVETSTSQHTTLRRDRHLCIRRDSKPQSQQANGRRIVHSTALLLRSAMTLGKVWNTEGAQGGLVVKALRY